MTNIKAVLKTLGLDDIGTYDNNFYVVPIENSDEYARVFSRLDKKAENTGYPSFGQNTSGNVVKVANYFELDVENVTYNLFLVADFTEDRYYLRIGEKNGAALM